MQAEARAGLQMPRFRRRRYGIYKWKSLQSLVNLFQAALKQILRIGSMIDQGGDYFESDIGGFIRHIEIPYTCMQMGLIPEIVSGFFTYLERILELSKFNLMEIF